MNCTGGKQTEIKVFAHESMQQALQQVQQICNDSQKKKFSDLFSLLDTNDEPEVTSRRPAARGGNKRATGRANNASRNSKQSNKEESEEESSEEEVIKKPTAKRRKKSTVVGSDSD